MKFNIVMTLLVKDEAEIIEYNIRYHAANGVDHFIVMDNGSKDGTDEIITSLKNEFSITLIIDPDPDYRQAEWMKMLAIQAKKYFSPCLVISNDADEFWIPEDNHNYKDILNHKDTVVTIKRRNSVFNEEILTKNYKFFNNSHEVIHPINYSVKNQINSERICMQLVPISNKVIINPKGLIKISGGNHRAKHWKFWRKRFEENINILHFPIRNFDKFKENIENRVILLERFSARMGPHYKRWVKIYKEGKIEEEFERMILDQNKIKLLNSIGVLAKSSNRLRDFLNKV